MNLNSIKNRLKELEQRLSPADDGTFTLEELCHAMWRENKSDFLELARGTCLRHFVAQFQREDAERQRISVARPLARR